MSTIAYSYLNTLLFTLFNPSTTVRTKTVKRTGTVQASKIESNISDPRVSFFEERVSALEKGTGAIVAKSTKSARFSIIKNLLQAGDNVVTFNSWSLYHEDLDIYQRLGIDIKLASNGSLDLFKELIDEQTKLVYLETISPKYLNIPDFQKIVSHAHSLGIPVVVDNSASVGGYLVKPIFNKADLVIESLEDYLPRHVKYKAVVVDGANFPWFNSRISKLGKRGDYSIDPKENNKKGNNKTISVLDVYRKHQTNKIDAFLIPSDPFSLVKRLDDIPAKAKLKSDNALKLARYLESHKLVKSVDYTGLVSNSSHFNAHTYFHNGFGHYLSFKLTVRAGLSKGFYQELSKEIPLRRNLSYDHDTQTISLNVPAIEYDELKAHFDAGFGLLKGSLEYYKVYSESFYV